MASGLTGPATDEEIARLRDAILEQRPEIRAHLARELGREPAEFRAKSHFEDEDR